MISSRFKYQDDMDRISTEYACECPRKGLEPIHESESYRYVFENINHENNFRPQLKAFPARYLNKNGNEKCNYLGLSMFFKLSRAKSSYRHFVQTFPNFSKTAGTHISIGILSSGDGMITKPDIESHFSLYEFEGVELRKKFNVLEKL